MVFQRLLIKELTQFSFDRTPFCANIICVVGSVRIASARGLFSQKGRPVMYSRTMSLRRMTSGAFSHRSGIVIALVAVSLIVMLGMLSLALDVGWMMNTKDQLQNAADSAAMAAAMELIQSDPEAYARQKAKDYVNLHKAGERMADVDKDSTTMITLGKSTWNSTNYVWSYEALPDATTGRDSVQVTVRRHHAETDPNRTALPLFFGGVLGRTQTDISATSVAQLSARDISVCQDVSGSMVFDSSFSRFDKHLSEGGSGVVPGVTINNADLYYGLSGNSTTHHIQTRMEATGVMYADSPVSTSGYSIYTVPTTGNVSTAYQAFADAGSGLKLGLIGTNLLPFGSPAVVDVHDPHDDEGLLFLPRGRWAFNSKPSSVPSGEQMNSRTVPAMHASDTTTVDGNLWGLLSGNTVNPAWSGIESDLRNRRHYSEEEIYCLRNPQDPNYTTHSPRNPAFRHASGNVSAASTAQEGTTNVRWQLRSMVILDMAKWNSGLLNPLWVLPNYNRPATSGNAFNAMLSTATGGTFTSNATWQDEVKNGTMGVRISRATGNVTDSMDLPQGKRFMSGNQQEWAFYDYSGVDGYRQGQHDWSNCITVYTTGSPTSGTFTLTVTKGTSATTASLSRNATAAQVQTALSNLSNVGANNVLCAGGPLPSTPIGVYFKISGVTNMTRTSSLSGGTAEVRFNQSYDDITSANTYTFKTIANIGYSGGDSPSFPALGTNGWTGSNGTPYTADDVIFGQAYYDANGDNVQDSWERTAKAWSLTKLANGSIPAAPNAGGAQWRWAAGKEPHLFSSDPLYQYHFWERDSSMSLPTTTTGNNVCWDNGEVRWPGTGESLDGRTTAAGLVSGNYTGNLTTKLNEKIILDDLSGTPTLNTYFNWVRSPSGATGTSYYGRTRLLQWRFGPKTLTECIVIDYPSITQSKYQFQLPIMPFQAGRDSIFAFAQYLYTMAQNQDYYAKDYVCMAIFGQTSQSRSLVVPLTDDYDRLWDKNKLTPNSLSTQQTGQDSGYTKVIPAMCFQAGHWDGATCTGGGLRRAWSEIDKTRSGRSLRQNSKPTILLVTDGRANTGYTRTRNMASATPGSSSYDFSPSGYYERDSFAGSDGVENYDGPVWDVDADGNMVQSSPPASHPNWSSYDSWYTSAMQDDPYGTPAPSDNNKADILTRQEAWFLAKQRNVTFHVVVIGNDGDPFLGNWIASISGGICIWVKGDPATYMPKLLATFRTLAAYKPVALVN